MANRCELSTKRSESYHAHWIEAAGRHNSINLPIIAIGLPITKGEPGQQRTGHARQKRMRDGSTSAPGIRLFNWIAAKQTVAGVAFGSTSDRCETLIIRRIGERQPTVADRPGADLLTVS